MPGVITSQELKAIQRRARLTNPELAARLGLSLSTVNRMRANGVRPEDEPLVRESLAQWLPPTEPDRYAQMSDAAILAEMNRMLGIIGQRLADCASRAGNDDRDDYRSNIGPGNNSPGAPSSGRRNPVQGTAGPPPQRRRNK